MQMILAVLAACLVQLGLCGSQPRGTKMLSEKEGKLTAFLYEKSQMGFLHDVREWALFFSHPVGLWTVSDVTSAGFGRLN